MKRLSVMSLLLIGVACATPKPDADTTSFASRPPDTVKPAPATNAAENTTTTDTKAKAKTAAQTKAGNPNIGRDSVIPFDAKNPRLRIPADTTKRRDTLSP